MLVQQLMLNSRTSIYVPDAVCSSRSPHILHPLTLQDIVYNTADFVYAGALAPAQACHGPHCTALCRLLISS